jgi:hypothetical protein
MSAPPRLALEPQGSWLQLRRHAVEQLQHPVASLIIIDTNLVRFGLHARNAALQIGVSAHRPGCRRTSKSSKVAKYPEDPNPVNDAVAVSVLSPLDFLQNFAAWTTTHPFEG